MRLLALATALVVLGACSPDERAEPDAAVRVLRQVVRVDDEAGFSRADFDDSHWAAATIPSELDSGGYGRVAWYRVHFERRTPGPVSVYLGDITGPHEVYLDGRRVRVAGRIAEHYVAHYGPAAPIELPEDPVGTQHVLAVRHLNHWVAGLASDPLRFGASNEMRARYGADIERDRLAHIAAMTCYGLIAMIFVALLTVARRKAGLVTALVMALMCLQWSLYESSLGDLIGRSPAWELLDLSLGVFSAVPAALIPILRLRLVPRVPRVAVGLGVGVAAVLAGLTALNPLWLLRYVWSPMWIVVVVGFVILGVLIVRRRGLRALGDPVVAASFLVAPGLALVEVVGSILPLGILRLVLSEAVVFGLLALIALDAVKQLLRDHRRLGRFDAELSAARRAERTLIASELHDGVAQELQLAHLSARRLVRDGHEMRDLPSQLRRVLTQLRDVSHGLPLDESADLVARLEALAAEVSRSAGLDMRVESPGFEAQLEPEAAHHLYRIVQQAVANALEHSHATSLEVRLTIDEGELVLEVADDGGPQPRQAHTPGQGLSSMKERVSSMSGLFEVQLTDQGTRVCVKLPLEGQGEAHVG